MKKFLTLFSLLTSLVTMCGQSVTLVWDASPDATVDGYRIYYGETSGGYLGSATVPAVPLSVSFEPQWEGDWFFAATALDSVSGLESDFSNEVIWHCPLNAPGPLAIEAVGPDTVKLSWPAWTKASLSPRHARYTLQVVSSGDLTRPRSEWAIIRSLTDLTVTSVYLPIDRSQPAQFFALSYTIIP